MHNTVHENFKTIQCIQYFKSRPYHFQLKLLLMNISSTPVLY
jgi:hypothetical protein